MAASEIDAIANRIARRLAFDPALAERIRHEVVDHLEESAERDSVQGAIERFGSTSDIVRDFAGQAMRRMVRTLAIGVATAAVLTFSAMKARPTKFAQHGDSLLPLASHSALLIDYAGFLLSVGAVALTFLLLRGRASAARFSLFVAVSALVASIGADLFLTAARFGRHGSIGSVALVAGIVELLLAVALLVAFFRIAPRVSAAASLAI